MSHGLHKPLGRKVYGTIPHMHGSRVGPADRYAADGQIRIATKKVRDRHDLVIVTEKLDGANTGVAMIDGQVVALGRSGYRASDSPFEHIQQFDEWVNQNEARFRAMLSDGELVVGEWLAMAHGTRYDLSAGETEPFVPFDLFGRDGKRRLWQTMFDVVTSVDMRPAQLLHHGIALPLDKALSRLGDHGYHGAIDRAEGVVYRVERSAKFDFLLKYVRTDKVDGKYFSEITGEEPVWNWTLDNAYERSLTR